MQRKCGWCPDLFEPLTSKGEYCSTRCRVAAWRERNRNQDRVTLRGRRRNADVDTRACDGPVAALYVRADGHYPNMPRVDAWDVERDAARYVGPHPVVAHPPCGPWGRFRHSCTTQRADLAVRAVDQVRRCGGVLEHPASSHLWIACELPPPGGKRDRWGGWTLHVRQSWWGHAAPKQTWIYIVGREDVLELPPAVPDPGGRIENMSRRQRELSPERFATWLVLLARGCKPGVFRKMGYESLPARAARGSNDSGPSALRELTLSSCNDGEQLALRLPADVTIPAAAK